MLRSTLCLVLFVLLCETPLEGYRTAYQQMASQQLRPLEQLIADLYSKDNPNPRETQSKLLSLARRSPAGRAAVIHRLIEVLEDAHDIMEKGRYQAWYNASAILGELRAAEAIEVLVKYLDFSDGVVGFPLANRPAVNALVQIGEPAVPKLSSTLLEAEGTRIRINAAEALGFIGDRHAREALERALVSEKDKSVAYEIRRALSLISRRRRAKRS